jgi:hypothetical protein
MFQVFLKMGPAIWKSKTSILNKFDATCHLSSFSGYIFSVLISILTIPVFFVTKENSDIHFIAVLFLSINCFMIWFYYFVAEVEARGLKIESFIYPSLLVIFSVGFSLNGVYAIIEAVLRKQTPFIRTPKFNNNIRKRFRSDNDAKPVYKAAMFFSAYFILLITIFNKHPTAKGRGFLDPIKERLCSTLCQRCCADRSPGRPSACRSDRRRTAAMVGSDSHHQQKSRFSDGFQYTPVNRVWSLS